MTVDTLGLLLAAHITPANEQERAQVAELARQLQHVTGQTVKLTFADQGYTDNTAAQAAREEGIELQVIKLPRRRRVSCRGFAAGLGGRTQLRLAQPLQAAARDYERLPETWTGLHFVVFAMPMLVHTRPIMQSAQPALGGA